VEEIFKCPTIRYSERDLKMKLISHRGNTNGSSNLENSPLYIHKAINAGFDVEVDVWYINDRWWLGHDGPQHKIDNIYTEFDNNKIWWHCKNFDALEKLQNSDLNYFWHQEDHHTLTSKGFIWTYPGKNVGKSNIIVMPELVMPLQQVSTLGCYGICSDYVETFL